MRTSAPPLLAIFRSQLQGDLLAQVFLGSTEAASISDLARRLDAPVATVHREVARLRDAGVLATARLGRAQLVTADDANPALGPLRELVLIAFGPRQVVTDEFTSVPGLRELDIFGPWAARYGGEAGPVPGGVDVLVVGDVERDAVDDAARRARGHLRRPVNPTVVSAARWAANAQPFLRQIRSGPLLRLIDRPDSGSPVRPVPAAGR